MKEDKSIPGLPVAQVSHHRALSSILGSGKPKWSASWLRSPLTPASAHWEASSRQRLANLIKLGALQVLSEPELQKFSFLNLKEAPSEPQTEETKSVRAGPG